MIFPWHFAVSSFAITIIKIILSGTIGAVLTFYVRYSSDDYANSIRWSRIGGLYETTTLLKNSHRKMPRRSCIIMAVMIVANVLTLFVAIFLGAFVSRKNMTSDPSSVAVVTGHFPTPTNLSWTDWSSFMPADAAMEDILVVLLNDTRLNPDPLPQTVYTPRKYDYEMPCDETGVALGDNITSIPIMYPSPHNNCKYVVVLLQSGVSYNWTAKNANSRTISEGVHMVTAPFSFSSALRGRFMELDPIVSALSDRICPGPISVSAISWPFPKDGLTSLPKTYATRCQYDTDDTLVIAATYIKFAVSRLSDFNKITNSIMEDASSLPLMQSMHTAINNGTFLTIPHNSTVVNSTLVILTSISTNVDLLICVSTFSSMPSTVGLLCNYVHVAVIAAKPQPWDPITPAVFKHSSTPDGFNITNKNEITIYHMPSGLKDSMDTYSIPHLLKATTDATVYLASLGHNVVMNQQANQLYVLYDTIEFKDAFEVPDALLIFLLVVTLVCIIVWAFSEKFTPVFNGSIYKVIYEDIKSKDDTTQMLMDCTHNPLAFEGYLVVPNLGEQASRSSQEFDMVVLENGSTDQPPAQQIPTQQTPTLQDIPAQSPLLPHASSFAPTPIMTPSSLVSTAFLASSTSPVNPATLVNTAASSNYAEAPSQSSQPVRSAYFPPIPPRPHANDGTLTRTSSTQVLPPLHTATSNVSQQTPSCPPSLPSTQSSTLIQNPFW